MICKACGKEITNGSKFCSECGAAQADNVRKSFGIKFERKERNAAHPHKKDKSLHQHIVACVVGVSAIILFFTPKSPSKFTLFLIIVVGLLYLCVENAKRDIEDQQQIPSDPSSNKPAHEDLIQQGTKVINTEEELQEFCEDHPLIDDFLIKVKGVTFRNDDGTSRQKILSYCLRGEQVWFRRFLYNGKPAYAVVTDHGEIGNLPADLAESMDYRYGSESYLAGTISDITGGVDGLYYGCILHLYVYGPSKSFD